MQLMAVRMLLHCHIHTMVRKICKYLVRAQLHVGVRGSMEVSPRPMCMLHRSDTQRSLTLLKPVLGVTSVVAAVGLRYPGQLLLAGMAAPEVCTWACGKCVLPACAVFHATVSVEQSAIVIVHRGMME